MHPAQWQTFIAQFSQLSQRKRLAGIALLQDGAAQDAAIALIEQTAQASLHCPACGARHIHRHGHAHGLQRYRCVRCGRTFNALTGTPLAHLHHKTQWLAYAGCLLASFSVRKAAEHVHIHRNTSFRWRHRFLALAKTDRPRCLHGITEADEMYLLESQKGARHLTRPPRQRASAVFPTNMSASWWRATAPGKPSTSSLAVASSARRNCMPACQASSIATFCCSAMAILPIPCSPASWVLRMRR